MKVHLQRAQAIDALNRTMVEAIGAMKLLAFDDLAAALAASELRVELLEHRGRMKKVVDPLKRRAELAKHWAPFDRWHRSGYVVRRSHIDVMASFQRKHRWP